MEPLSRRRLHRLHRHRLGRPRSTTSVCSRRARATRVRRIEHRRCDRPMGAADATALRRSDRGGLELAKGPTRLRPAEVRLLRALSDQSGHPGQVPRGFKPSRAKDDPTDAELALELLLVTAKSLTPASRRAHRCAPCSTSSNSAGGWSHDRAATDQSSGVRAQAVLPASARLVRAQGHDRVLRLPQRGRHLRRSSGPGRRPSGPSSGRTTCASGRHRRRAPTHQGRHAADQDPAVITPTGCRRRSWQPAARPTASHRALRRGNRRNAPSLPDLLCSSPFPVPAPALPRLFAAFGEQRERFASAEEVQRYSGVAPVTERSGNKHWVHWRWHCPSSCGRRSSNGPPAIPIPSGQALLRQQRQGLLPQSRRARLGLQVDPHPVSLLADANALRRVHLPQRTQKRGSPLLSKIATPVQ